MTSVATPATACCPTQVGTAGAGTAGGGACPVLGSANVRVSATQVRDAALRASFMISEATW